jgi:Protein kinase domain
LTKKPFETDGIITSTKLFTTPFHEQFYQKEMNTLALENVKEEIEKIENKIKLAEEKLWKYQEKLENIPEGQPTTLWEKLLDSATQELHDLRQEKSELRQKELELLKKETALLQITNKFVSMDDVTKSLKCLKLDCTPSKGSGFTASNNNIIINCGVNGIFTCTFNLPSIVQNAIAVSPQLEDKCFAKAVIDRGLLFSMFPVKAPETGKGRTVDGTIGDSLRQFFSYKSALKIQGQSNTNLSKLNASIGPTTESSIPDIVCTLEIDSRLFGLAVVELKDTSCSPLEQIGQAYAYGCNIVLSHYQVGVEAANCAVPLTVTNGNLYQFGWVSLLEPSFPVLHITTGILDASCQSMEIAEHLSKMKIYCQENAKKIQVAINSKESPISDTKISLDVERYHRKKMKDIFCRFGTSEFEKSLQYQWNVYHSLADVIEVVKPLTFARLKYEKLESPELIFPMLKGFKMGIPNSAEEFDCFMKNLTIAIKKIHMRGIVHVDLYPSNILWNNDNGNMVIRIVDWDVATMIDEIFAPEILARFKNPEVSQYYYTTTDRAQTRCDYWFLYILSRLSAIEKQTMNGDIATVNEVYRNSVNRLLDETDGKAALVNLFEYWFSSQ